MTAPTGEAVNYETTIAGLDALAAEQRGHIDACQAALRCVNEAKAAIDSMQESYRQSAAAAAATHEHLAAQNLDATTLAHTGTAADAMPAGAVDQMYDQLEGMETEAKARLADAEAALAATEAARAHIVATYGDAHATVAGDLGGDASFLDASGAVADATARGEAGWWGGAEAGGAPAQPAPPPGTPRIDLTYQPNPADRNNPSMTVG
jgi:hypothetical protein